MRRRRGGRRESRTELSLVPMADLLTNTVGALVFIMIFTVLTAGGGVILKKLPLEKNTEAEPLNFVCEGGRIIPLDSDALAEKIRERWGEPPTLVSFDDVLAFRAWIERLNTIQVEDDYFVAKGEGRFVGDTPIASVALTVKKGAGETEEDIAREDSAFRRALAAHKPEERFVHFFVRPDSLDVFFAARDMAIEQSSYRTGWMPLGQIEPLRFSNYGRAAKEQ